MTDSGVSPDFIRLGDAIARRRAELDLSQEALARTVDVSVSRIGAIEQGNTAARKAHWGAKSYAAIEEALGWVRGSCRLVAEGGEPVVQGSEGHHSESDTTRVVVGGGVDADLAAELERQADAITAQALREARALREAANRLRHPEAL